MNEFEFSATLFEFVGGFER